jgi:hypothetical protein
MMIRKPQTRDTYHVRKDTLSERDKKPVIRSTETRYDEPFKWGRIVVKIQSPCAHDWRGIDTGRMCAKCGLTEAQG